jgi:hypothetical protein
MTSLTSSGPAGLSAVTLLERLRGGGRREFRRGSKER